MIRSSITRTVFSLNECMYTITFKWMYVHYNIFRFFFWNLLKETFTEVSLEISIFSYIIPHEIQLDINL
jgi:hypothetical protein